MSSYMDSQKLLLVDYVEKEVKEQNKLSQRTKDFIDYFYKWKELGFYGALKEFQKIK